MIEAESRETVVVPASRKVRIGASVALLIVYVLADIAVRSIAERNVGIIPWYPGAGLGLAFLVLSGPVGAVALFAARLFLDALTPVPVGFNSHVPIFVLEAALQVAAYTGASVVIRRHVLPGLAAWRVRHAVWLIGSIAAAALLAGVASGLEMMVTRGIGLGVFVTYAARFAAGDTAGAIVVLPACLIIHTWSTTRRQSVFPEWKRFTRSRHLDASQPNEEPQSEVFLLERTGQAIAVVLAIAIATMLLQRDMLGEEYLTLVCLLPVVWVALRDGIVGVALMLAVYGIAFFAYVVAGNADTTAALQVQRMLLVLGGIALLLGAARTESAEAVSRYWHLLATAGEGVWRVDGSGRTLYVNERMAAILGTSVRDVLKRDVRDFIASEYLPSWDEERRERTGGVDSLYETALVAADGRRIHVLVSASVVRNTSGAAVGSVALVTDITPLRQAEADRRRAQVLLETIFRRSHDAMILYRASDQLILDVNDVWCEATGHTRDEVIGHSQAELQIWGNPADADRLAHAIRKNGEVRDFEIAFNRIADNGVSERRFALLSTFPAMVEGEKYFLVSARDVTADKQREDSERQLRRFEELGRLAGGVAHDFNNLLTVVLAYTQFALVNQRAGNPVAASDLEEIEHAVRRGQELTKRLLAFSRHQTVDPRVVDLNAVVTSAVAMLSSVLAPAQFDVRQAPRPLPVLADPSQLDEILLNLALNARDAISHTGRVTVTTEFVQGATGEVAAFTGSDDASSGDFAVLRVRDSGSGMDERTKAHIFEPFFTTKPPGKGTGLGLSVVLGIVQRAQGAIRVESEPGHGSTFSIYWPITRDLPAQSVAEPAVPDRKRGMVRSLRGARILLVEDESAVRTVTQRVLRKAGYEVHTANNGARALQRIAQLESAGVPPDVVLSDVIMPELGGRELAEKLAVLKPGLPVILMSGYSGMSGLRDGLTNVPEPILEKPFELERLLTTVARILDT